MVEEIKYYELSIRIPCNSGGCWEKVYIQGRDIKLSHPNVSRSHMYFGNNEVESKLEEISKEEFEKAEKETPVGLWWLK